MQSHRLTTLAALALAAILLAAIASPVPVQAAEDGCRGFSWDVTRERSLFGGNAKALAAGADSGTAPALVPARLYALRLKPIAQVNFVTAPGRKSPEGAGYAGLATLGIPAGGLYRISVDAPVWIDVVADGGLMGVRDFQGAHDCAGPRKILLFEFPVPRQVVLQVSGASSASVRIGVTAVAAP